MSENAGHHCTHIYLQHRGVQIKIIYLYLLYLMSIFSSNEMTSMGVWAIIEGIRMVSNHSTYRWVREDTRK